MIRVMVIDDSALVRKILTEELSRLPGIEVVGSAVDPYVARDKILKLRPDVLTLDIEMPRMDGLSFLEKLMRHHPLPVIVLSSMAPRDSEAAVRALALGAVEVIPKPASALTLPDVVRQLGRAVRAAATARVQPSAPPRRASAARAPYLAQLPATQRMLAVGASTGGAQAIETILRALPSSAPGIVIVQHMPEGFTASFAKRLDGACAVQVREACDGDAVLPGLVLIAPGGRHTLVERSGARILVRVTGGPPVHHQRPSVDVLFQSVARSVGRNSVGVLLTGMGADGARGLLAMREAGAHTIAQDEASCIVYGMPREAVRLGAAAEVLPLSVIPGSLMMRAGAPAAGE